MYDAWDSRAVAAPVVVVFFMVIAKRALYLYIVNVKYLQVLFCILFICPFLGFFLSNPVYLVKVVLQVASFPVGPSLCKRVIYLNVPFFVCFISTLYTAGFVITTGCTNCKAKTLEN